MSLQQPRDGDDAASDDSSSSASAAPLDLQPDAEWQDVEEDSEQVSIHSFFSPSALSSTPQAFLHDCKSRDHFDLAALLTTLGGSVSVGARLGQCAPANAAADPDFYAAIKLVNYLRQRAKDGATAAQLAQTTRTDFEDDRYLQPALEDDALLFCLDDVLSLVQAQSSASAADPRDAETAALKSRIAALEDELASLQSNFLSYRVAVAETLDKRWSSAAGPSSATDDAAPASAAANPAPTPRALSRHPTRDTDSYYFDSYAYNDIHETMLKDAPRTGAYRDFIYNHKPLFAGRTVLDVGCGTGILSLFAARAGAARVFAVDNSNIVDQARRIVAANNAADVVRVVRGKIEDVDLPFDGAPRTVDVLVSEWMGYALLYEAMLPSVLRARDAYLAPGGVMAPSHCALLLAPLADPDYVADTAGFWGDVYGFDMRAMTAGMYDDVVVRPASREALCGPGTVFKVLDLATVRNGDLDFVAPFALGVARDVDALDGFVVWFDTYFLPARGMQVEAGARAETWAGEGVAFTTGPGGETTHWMSGWLMVDRRERAGVPLAAGQTIRGTVGYARRADNERQIDIVVEWAVEGTAEAGKQTWSLK